MLKIAAIVSLMLIATWSQADSRKHKKDATAPEDFEPSGSTLWAAGISCDSCGSECASACGTRHFRSCCFNYLRKKRGPEGVKFWYPNPQEMKENQVDKMPVYLVKSLPEPWYASLSNDFKPYPFEDAVDNHMQIVYDA
ncbi:uncharacterized protein LOC114363193 isoform X1 [Ostrinia furnacalis]|uniref:uncharacterized protein LOC114363193 isoform X1 n=1 Tax=Ostrinia furnacalis TaxID=93504 RepID=UPI001039001F|nr:uncharacterized protein LOC114363193 isoform X1 [Ostrinia furnacalis]